MKFRTVNRLVEENEMNQQNQIQTYGTRSRADRHKERDAALAKDREEIKNKLDAENKREEEEAERAARDEDKEAKAAAAAEAKLEAEAKRQKWIQKQINYIFPIAKEYNDKNIDISADVDACMNRAYSGCLQEYQDFMDEIAKDKKEKGKDSSFKDHKYTFTGNPLFISLPGTGKSTIVNQWGDKFYNKGVRVVEIKNLKPSDVGAMQVPELVRNKETGEYDRKAVSYYSDAFQSIVNRPGEDYKFVLFLDEINTLPPGVKAHLHELLANHYLNLGSVQVEFPDLLFVVGAMNPFDKTEDPFNDYQLPTAIKDRFTVYNFNATREISLKWMPKKYGEEVEKHKRKYEKWKEDEKKANDPEELKFCQDSAKTELGMQTISLGKQSLANTILGNKKFEFTTKDQFYDVLKSNEGIGADVKWNGLITEPRNLEKLLDDTNGTVENLRFKWNGYCSNLYIDEDGQPQDINELLDEIFSGYKNVEDLASDYLKNDALGSMSSYGADALADLDAYTNRKNF